ncbi:MAG: cell wall hydrolase [Clostridia bacterium]
MRLRKKQLASLVYSVMLSLFFATGLVIGLNVEAENEIFYIEKTIFIEKDYANSDIIDFVSVTNLAEEEIISVIDIPTIEALAKTLWGEARGCSIAQKEAVVWCILNRVDSDIPFFKDTIMGVITQDNQFHGYNVNNPVEEDLYELALNVVAMWHEEKDGENIRRVLPKEYLYFYGDGKENHFTTEWLSNKTWDWGC